MSTASMTASERENWESAEESRSRDAVLPNRASLSIFQISPDREASPAPAAVVGSIAWTPEVDPSCACASEVPFRSRDSKPSEKNRTCLRPRTESSTRPMPASEATCFVARPRRSSSLDLRRRACISRIAS